MSALFKITHKQTWSASASLLTSHRFWNLVPVSGPLWIPVLLMKKVKESRKSGSSYVCYCVMTTSSDRGGRWWTWVSFSDGLAGCLLEYARHADESHTGCIDKHTRVFLPVRSTLEDWDTSSRSGGRKQNMVKDLKPQTKALKNISTGSFLHFRLSAQKSFS